MVKEAVCIVWKVSVFGVFLVRIFPNLDWIPENRDQKNSEYEHFSRSGDEIKNLNIFKTSHMK